MSLIVVAIVVASLAVRALARSRLGFDVLQILDQRFELRRADSPLRLRQNLRPAVPLPVYRREDRFSNALHRAGLRRNPGVAVESP